MMLVINGIGIALSRELLGDHAMICVLVASGWCVACIVALRLIDWTDWSGLESAPQAEASRTVESHS
jgi:hypothetical protein